MAEMSTVVEGKVKFRHGKKWKPRWCVMKKPSPIADRLLVQLYKDVKDSIKGGSPKSSFPLDGFYGLESGICFDKETSVLAIICQKLITLFAFDSRETLIQFEIKIRRSLGEEHQFPVRTIKVPSSSKLPLDLVRLHIHGQKFCLTGQIPPKILCTWQVSELRRFGVIDGRFCFEGGSRCGKGQGFHVLQTDQAEEISEILTHASSGKSVPLIKRQTSKRRSELLEPGKNAIGDSLFRKFQNTQVYLDTGYQDDNIWPRQKRHSISFTDYKRTRSYAEKQRLMSIENVDRERLMAIYDIPPRRIRKVESVQRNTGNNSANVARNFDVNLDALRGYNPNCAQTNDNYMNWTGEFNNNVMSYQVPPQPVAVSTVSSYQSDTSSLHGSQLSLQSITLSNYSMPISSSAPALSGYGNQPLSQDHSYSVPQQLGEEIDRVMGDRVMGDRAISDRVMGDKQREEILQSLQQSEQDLQKEMHLLDELLQKENIRTEEVPTSGPPPLPEKSSSIRKKVLAGLTPRRSLDNISISSDSTHCRPQGSYSNSTLLSPNLSHKLKKLSRRSKVSAPLPYVNLDKYDVGDIDTNHVHLPAASTSAPDGGMSWNEILRSKSRGYDNVGSGRDGNKENKRISVSLPGSRENLRHICGSDLQLNLKRNNSYTSEPIYANDPADIPPELPPKGPALLQKLNEKRTLNAASRPPPPPRPPERHHSLSKQYPERYYTPSLSSGSSSLNSSQQEDYFLMDSFEREPPCRMQLVDSTRLNESLFERPIVALPPRNMSTPQTGSDPSSCYMDMSWVVDQSRSAQGSDTSLSERPASAQKPKYSRSLSATSVGDKDREAIPPRQPPPRPESISVSEGNSPREVRRELPIREENYMLMSSLTPRKPILSTLRTLDYVSANLSGSESKLVRRRNSDADKSVSSVAEEAESDVKAAEHVDTSDNKTDDSGAIGEDDVLRPFENLLDFNVHHDDVKPLKAASSGTSVDKVEGSNGKPSGFFSRLMRRNSKDRKSVSQSHENLLADGSGDMKVKEEMTILMESSSSGENSRSDSQQDLVFCPKDRTRSSSFPNRSSYLAMTESNSSSSTGISILSQQSDLGATNSSLNSCETSSTRASSNECQLNSIDAECVLSDSEKCEKSGLKGNYDKQSYFFMGPLDANGDKTFEQSGDASKSEEEEHITDSAVDDDEKASQDSHGSGKVFTVLNVQGGNFASNSCKTDDEKLIELWHSTHSLNSDKYDKGSISDLKSKLTLPLEDLSPDEKASAIARHIHSLPPFVPPKMKSYGVKLSPVLERTTPKREKPNPLLGEASFNTSQTDEEKGQESPVLSPSLMKQQAKATLRITPPSEDENGKIWIPRSSLPLLEDRPAQDSADINTSVSSLVVDVGDPCCELDSMSESSIDSACHGEEVIRSSPASTILRPRSGKEYQKVSRRRTMDNSNTTSPLTTPQSPTTGSVFTFDLGQPYSASHSCQGELQSPKFSKLTSSEQASIYQSLRSESIHSPKAMYMNIDLTPAESHIDFTPPESPLFQPCSLQAEQLEPMLNYAEIDLSEAGTSESATQVKKLNYLEMDLSTSTSDRYESFRQTKKGKKTPEPVPTEYSTIDMVATVAAQKARKEHAQSRDGSLRRNRSSNLSCAKERVGSMSSKAERKHAQTHSAGQSTTSMDSSSF